MTTSEVSVSAVDLRELRAELLAAGLGGRAFTKAYAEAVDEWLRPLFAKALGGSHKIVGIEIAETSPSHLWDRPPAPTDSSPDAWGSVTRVTSIPIRMMSAYRST